MQLGGAYAFHLSWLFLVFAQEWRKKKERMGSAANPRSFGSFFFSRRNRGKEVNMESEHEYVNEKKTKGSLKISDEKAVNLCAAFVPAFTVYVIN